MGVPMRNPERGEATTPLQWSGSSGWSQPCGRFLEMVWDGIFAARGEEPSYVARSGHARTCAEARLAPHLRTQHTHAAHTRCARLLHACMHMEHTAALSHLPLWAAHGAGVRAGQARTAGLEVAEGAQPWTPLGLTLGVQELPNMYLLLSQPLLRLRTAPLHGPQAGKVFLLPTGCATGLRPALPAQPQIVDNDMDLGGGSGDTSTDRWHPPAPWWPG